MIETILKNQFTTMPWKNGRGTTTQMFIFPAEAKLENNDFLYRFSSAPVQENGDFSIFPRKMRILTPVKGTGFKLNSQIYEKFDIAHFRGDEKIYCTLLKEPVLDFGIIYDPEKIKVHPRVLHLKSDVSFTLEPASDYFVTVLNGTLFHHGQPLKELETLHYSQDSFCQLKVPKSAVLFFLKMDFKC